MSAVDHITGHTWHGRKGAIENAFRYGIDYVLLDAEAPLEAPRLFGRNRTGLPRSGTAIMAARPRPGAARHGSLAVGTRGSLKSRFSI